MKFDRSIIANKQRQDFHEKHKFTAANANVLVCVLSEDGKVFSSCVRLGFLGPDYVEEGDHKGLIWWPEVN